MIIIIDEASAKLASFYYHDELQEKLYGALLEKLPDELQKKLPDELQKKTA